MLDKEVKNKMKKKKGELVIFEELFDDGLLAPQDQNVKSKGGNDGWRITKISQ
jgi:hypothetical protein